MQPKQAAILCVHTLADKLAQDIVVLDVRQLVDVADFFVICTGRNDRHTRSLADDLAKEAARNQLPKFGIEGTSDAQWVLIDLGDVIVNIFSQDARAFYDLEMLWGDAPRVDWDIPDVDIQNSQVTTL